MKMLIVVWQMTLCVCGFLKVCFEGLHFISFSAEGNKIINSYPDNGEAMLP